MWFIYVLYSGQYDKLYIGVTNDLERRVAEHVSGKTHTTARLGEIELIYYEACKDKRDATARERQLKTGFGRGYIRRRVEHYLRARSSVG